MKPPHPHAQGEGSWGHDVKRAIGDRLRKAYDATVIMSFDRRMKIIDEDPKTNGFDRRSGSGSEDPIRRVMFLGPWSHTWASYVLKGNKFGEICKNGCSLIIINLHISKLMIAISFSFPKVLVRLKLPEHVYNFWTKFFLGAKLEFFINWKVRY